MIMGTWQSRSPHTPCRPMPAYLWTRTRARKASVPTSRQLKTVRCRRQSTLRCSGGARPAPRCAKGAVYPLPVRATSLRPIRHCDVTLRGSLSLFPGTANCQPPYRRRRQSMTELSVEQTCRAWVSLFLATAIRRATQSGSVQTLPSATGSTDTSCNWRTASVRCASA